MENENNQEQVEQGTEGKIEINVPENADSVVIIVPEGVDVEVQQTTKEEEPVKAPTQLDNVLTLGMVGALVLAVIAVIIRKALSNKKAASASVAEEISETSMELPTAPGSAGHLKLHDVEPKTAAMLMAIVADKLQKPINELRFVSIKEVK